MGMPSVEPLPARARPESEPVRPGAAHMLLFYVSCGFPVTYLSMVSLLLALRADELGIDPGRIGVLLGAGGVLGTIMAVPSGALADAIGARRAFTLGALLNALAAFGLAFTDNFAVMLGIQFVRGFPHSISWVASQTYATGIGNAADRARITGRFTFSTNIASLIAPFAIGAVAQVVGYQMGLAVVGAYAAVHILSGLLLPELRRKAPGQAGSAGAGGFREAREQLRERPTQVALILTFVRILVLNGWAAFFPVYLAQRGFEPALIGTILSANGIVSAVTGLWAGWIARRSSNEVATAVALALGGLGVAVSPHILVVPFVYLPALLMGSGTGLSMPLVMAILGNAVPPERRGVAMGLRTTGNQLGTVVAPILLGQLVTLGGVVMAFAMNAAIAWLMLAGAMALHFGGRRKAA